MNNQRNVANKKWIVATAITAQNNNQPEKNVDYYLVDFSEDHYHRLLSCLLFS
jgi:hypothetical protein